VGIDKLKLKLKLYYLVVGMLYCCLFCLCGVWFVAWVCLLRLVF